MEASPATGLTGAINITYWGWRCKNGKCGCRGEKRRVVDTAAQGQLTRMPPPARHRPTRTQMALGLVDDV